MRSTDSTEGWGCLICIVAVVAIGLVASCLPWSAGGEDDATEPVCVEVYDETGWECE